MVLTSIYEVINKMRSSYSVILSSHSITISLSPEKNHFKMMEKIRRKWITKNKYMLGKANFFYFFIF